MESCKDQTGVNLHWKKSFYQSHPTLNATYIFSRRGQILLLGSKLSWTIVNMETYKSKIEFLWVIDQRPFFLFIFSFNIFLSFTVTLGNTLILIALHKVSDKIFAPLPGYEWLLCWRYCSAHFLLPFWWESQVETGLFLTWLWISLTSSSVDFLSQQFLPLPWTGFSRCYWDWDTDTQ